MDDRDFGQHHNSAGGALFRHTASSDATCSDGSPSHPSTHPTPADDNGARVFVIALADVACAVAWVAPADPAPMRRRRDLVDAAAALDVDDLPRWRALFKAAGFSLEDINDEEAEDPDDSARVDLDSIMAVRITPTVQRVVFAEDARCKSALPAVPVSVFDLAEKPMELRGRQPITSTVPPQTAQRIERLEGITRCTSIVIQDTPEWMERERQRRARQRPPRPPRGAKTRSKKLSALIGEEA